MNATSIRAMAVFLTLTGLPCVGQQAPNAPNTKFTISGIVTESGRDRGLPDVEVQLETFQSASVSSDSSKTIAARTVTSAGGSFHFTVHESARYRITIHKDGYTPSNAGNFARPTTATFLLDRANPAMTFQFELARPIQLSGAIVDSDTRDPIAGLMVRADGYSYRNGRIALSMHGTATTGERGRFQFKDLPPGNYVISAGPGLYTAAALARNQHLTQHGHARFLTPFTAGDTKETDEDYDTTYWPGGGGLETAFPLAAPSGADLDVGTLPIRSVTMYRARVDVPAGPCAAGSAIHLHLRRISNPWQGTTLGTVACGGGGVVRGLTPGQYQLEATGGGTKGSIEFTVARENASVSVPLQRGVSLDGVVSLQGPTPIDRSAVRLVLKPRTWAVQHPPIVVSADGRFHVEGVATRDYALLVTGIPPTHCLREMRYNGKRTSGHLFSLDPYALDHKLELVVDDQAATLSGAVTIGNDRAFRPWIVLAPWPPTDDLYAAATVMAADDDGQFHIAGLVPGEYRLVAVPAESVEELHRPEALAGLLRNAQKLELAGKETRTVQVKAVTPRPF